MNKVLIVFAHPQYQNSKSNKALLDTLNENNDVLIHNLALEYPDGKIDVEKEQALLKSYDRIIFQFPTFWFNVPGLFKTWLDEVFTYGWAYGPNGTALEGKKFGIVTTTGGVEEAYQKEGARGFEVQDFLTPVIGSIKYVNAEYLGFVHLSNAFAPTEEQFYEAKNSYNKLIFG